MDEVEEHGIEVQRRSADNGRCRNEHIKVLERESWESSWQRGRGRRKPRR